MGDFDFRNWAGGKVKHDPAIADGLDGHWLVARTASYNGGANGNTVADAMVHGLVLNCVMHQHCPPAILSLMIAKLCEPVPGHDPATQAEMKRHVLHEVRTMLDAIERGEI